jgi:internalin A
LPDSLGDLTTLTVFWLDDNQLTDLPDWVGNLTALTMFSFRRNRLTQVA